MCPCTAPTDSNDCSSTATPCKTLQHAINLTAGQPGYDTVSFVLPPGVTSAPLNESVTIGTGDVTINGSLPTGDRITLVTKERSVSPIDIKAAARVTITSINFIGSRDGHSAIYIHDQASEITLNNCDFTNYTGKPGHGVSGGAIAVVGPHNAGYAFDVLIRGCYFTRCNTSWDGGAISLNNMQNATITGCVFEGNEAGITGGALWGDHGNASTTIDISRCVFSNNRAYDYRSGGAIIMWRAGRFSLEDSRLTGNAAMYTGGSSDGGAMYLSDNKEVTGRAQIGFGKQV